MARNFLRMRSIRSRLALLSASVVLPAMLAAALVIVLEHREGRATVEKQLLDTSRALSLAVERQLGQTRALLRALAVAPALAEGDYEAFHQQARAALGDGPGWVTVLRRDGQQLLNTGLEWGQPLPIVMPAADLRAALEQGRPYISNLLISATQQRPTVLVALPYPAPDSEILALVKVLPVETLCTILREQGLPPSWNASIVDRNGYVVARTRNSDLIGERANERGLNALAQGASGTYTNTLLDGVVSLAGFNRVPGADWSLVLSAPERELLAPLTRLLGLVGLVLFGLIAIGGAMSMWFGRAVVRAVDGLVADARALGQAAVPAVRPRELKEAQVVAGALRDSALALRAREAELLRLNQDLEARVEEATERLVAASKLEAVGQITGGVAHDFNNLLAAVRINLELAERHFPAARARKHIEAALASSERGAKLVAQLLAFARKQRLVPEPVDVNVLIEQLAGMLQSTLGGAVSVRLELARQLEPALADPTQLELMVMNLAINARDAMPEGGVLRIETGRARLTEQSGPEAPAPGDYVFITVADSGTGISPELLSKVFEPFFTTKALGAGSGLGLPQVLGSAKQLGGGLHIDSREGEGTAVQILLPLAAAQAQTPSGQPALAQQSAVLGIKVLLVDDDHAVRAAVTQLLRDEGVVVVAFDSGDDALQALADGLQPQVALLDYAMPELNGLALAERLAELEPSLPVVLMTGYADVKALEQRWHGQLLHKPFSQPEVVAALARAVAAATPVTD